MARKNPGSGGVVSGVGLSPVWLHHRQWGSGGGVALALLVG